MRYTDYMEKSLFLWEEEDATEEMILEFLEQEENFLTFGERLERIIRRKMSGDEVLSPQEYLTNKVKEKHLDKAGISRNTIPNWFAEDKHRKSPQSREHMYLISFALELTEEETRELFTKVYFDRPFNVREKREFVYLYCIRNGLPYSGAESMLQKLMEQKVEERFHNKGIEETMQTLMLTRVLQDMQDEDRVLAFMKKHEHSFQINNQSVQIIISTLLREILTDDKEQTYLAKEIERDPELLKPGAKATSYSNMLAVITGVNLVKASELKGKSVYKTARLPKEIMNRFPTTHTFSKWNRWTKEGKQEAAPTAEELRKMLILLFSYRFWYQVQYEDREKNASKDKRLQVYMEELDDLLAQSNLQPLYYGNPFDWLFLYCTLLEEPLTGFRFLYDEVFAEE
ncbi:MAG: hypothetical protein IJX63_10620 [Lachnospiraceae bacterium]|nr:hypothetical protein [Lachnospiraceae bacterium]